MSDNSELDNCKALELWFNLDKIPNNSLEEEHRMIAEEICPQRSHITNIRRITWTDFIQISKTETEGTQLNSVESISLVTETSMDFADCDKKLTESDAKRIIETCPNLVCFAIIKTSFTMEGWIYLVNQIFPVLQTLSISDEISVFNGNIKQSIDWKTALTMLTNLEDLKLKLTQTDGKFNANCLQFLTENLISFYFVDISGVNNLKDIIENLNKGNGRLLEFIRIESEEKNETVIESYRYIAQLKQLRGLNLSIRNSIKMFEHIIYAYIKDKPIELFSICELENLQTLTIKIYFETRAVLQILSFGKFKNNLTRLRLNGAELDFYGFDCIFRSFKNLECLQLIDTNIEDMDQIVQLMTNLPNFNEILIENCPNLNQDHYKYIIEHRIQKIRIENGLSDEDKEELIALALQLSTAQREIEVLFY